LWAVLILDVVPRHLPATLNALVFYQRREVRLKELLHGTGSGELRSCISQYFTGRTRLNLNFVFFQSSNQSINQTIKQFNDLTIFGNS
jgi:hypothetical protein